MENSKKHYELQALDSWDFPLLIRKAREIQGITLEALCKGICSFSMMGKVEKGERFLNKELRDRVLARLGMCSDGYENFLFHEDYTVWKREQQIVNAIEKSDYQTAEKLLAYYDEEDKVNENEDVGKLRRQFALVMKAQIMQKRGEDKAEIAKLCEEAVKLTVPDIDDKPVGVLCLSIQELDMILEYEKYCHPDRLSARCEEILAYIDNEIFDTYSSVKIFPKVVCYLYMSMEDRDWNKLLRLCGIGIEQLRASGRMYYLWELLEIKKEGMQRLLETVGDSKGERTKQVLVNVIDTTTEWLDALDFVHDLCGTHRKMETSCYLYQQKEAYCIGDVIKHRREMLGYTKKKLCEGICSEKTIGRLEAGKTKPQIEIVKKLFERLKLSGEYQRWQIVTKDAQAFVVVDEIIRCANNRDFDRTEELLQELRQYISMDNPINRQFAERIAVNIKLGKGELSKKEAMLRFKNVLEYTVPYEAAVKKGTKYLTNAEILSLINIALCMDVSDMKTIFEVLEGICGQLEKDDGISEHIAVWEIIMINIINMYGDMGEYDKSDAINILMMRECLHCYRMNMLATNLYNSIWSYISRIKKNIPVKQECNEISCLKKCISLCQISNNIIREKMIKERIIK